MYMVSIYNELLIVSTVNIEIHTRLCTIDNNLDTQTIIDMYHIYSPYIDFQHTYEPFTSSLIHKHTC